MRRVFDRLLAPGLEGDLEESRRERIIAGTASCLAVAALVGLSLRLTIVEPPPAVIAIVLISATIFAAIPRLIRTTGSLTLAGGLVSAVMLGLIVSSGYLLGGLDGPVLVLAPLVPLIATLGLGARAGLLVAVLVCLTIVLFAAFHYWGFGWPTPPPEGQQVYAARALILCIAVALAAIFAAIFEHEWIRSARALAKSENLYRRIFEQSKDTVALSTPDGRHIDMNQAGLDLYGFRSKAEWQRLDARQLYPYPAERDALIERLATEGYVQGYELRHFTCSGEIRTVEGTTSTIRDEAGEVTVLLTILRDVTEQRRRQLERLQMVAELAERNAELERFGYTVSHDLKSPLITIKGFLGQLDKDLAAGNRERIRSDFGRIAKAADIMSLLIDDLLEFSRIGQVTEDLSEVSLNTLAHEAAELLAGRIAERGARVEISADLPRIPGTRTLLRMVFQNLIANAIKFCGERGDPLVEIDVRHLDAETVYCVADNGVGIAPEDQERIFGLFEKLDHKAQGTGIGLASVKRIVAIHGGRIWVESEGVGHGATFCFTLADAKESAVVEGTSGEDRFSFSQ